MVKARKLMQYAALLASVGVWWLAGLYLYLSPNLPEADTLRNITLQTPMRVVSREGALIGQFGEQKRKPLQFDQIPQSFIDALLAAEDDGFFSHSGIEPLSLGRAISELVLTGKKGSGGSTLTMQVARNYFLSLERTFLRKFNEILLALEIEQTLSKLRFLSCMSIVCFWVTEPTDSRRPQKHTTASPLPISAWPNMPCWPVYPKHPHAITP